MKVLFACSEAVPFKASGGLAEVAGSLPQALRKRFVGARVVLPLYGSMAQAHKDSLTFLGSIQVPVAWRRQYCGVFELRQQGLVTYFLDNEYYFKRDDPIYGHYDDAERFAFFARAVLEMLPMLPDFKPDLLHCNDWQTALIPVYQTLFYGKLPFYQSLRTLFTIHNIEYQGSYDRDILEDVLGLSAEHAHWLEHGSGINLLKGAVECADAVSTVSPSYAQEILQPSYAHGLSALLQQRAFKLHGILNGIDVKSYNPASDPAIAAAYSAENRAGKTLCKAALQNTFGLEQNLQAPLLGIVSRLVAHKGMGLLAESLDAVLQASPAQLVVLGTGDAPHEDFFRALSTRYPQRVGVCIGFEPALARQIYAGTDLFLMPSLSEPCGLAQMIALRYGSIPVVRQTGGLQDTVQDSGTGEGNGFCFADPTPGALQHTLFRALGGYQNQEGWGVLQQRAMQCDYSWSRSAADYLKLYKGLCAP